MIPKFSVQENLGGLLTTHIPSPADSVGLVDKQRGITNSTGPQKGSQGRLWSKWGGGCPHSPQLPKEAVLKGQGGTSGEIRHEGIVIKRWKQNTVPSLAGMAQ